MKANLARGLAGMAVLTGAAAAWQLGSAFDNPNFDAKRLQGRWALNWDITSRLDPARRVVPPKFMQFVEDAKVLELLRNEPRFKGHKLYLAGWMNVNGMEDHPFAVASDGGPVPHLLVLNPTRTDPMGDIVKWDFTLVLAQKPIYDILFLGGDEPREAMAAYDRKYK